MMCVSHHWHSGRNGQWISWTFSDAALQKLKIRTFLPTEATLQPPTVPTAGVIPSRAVWAQHRPQRKYHIEGTPAIWCSSCVKPWIYLFLKFPIQEIKCHCNLFIHSKCCYAEKHHASNIIWYIHLVKKYCFWWLGFLSRTQAIFFCIASGLPRYFVASCCHCCVCTFV